MLKGVTGRNILFVDDNESLCRAQAEYFRKRGNTAEEAATLASAKRLLSEQNFDAVILDLLLPDGEGLELFESVKKLPPVIIQTTLGNEYDVLDGFSAGAVDYVVKPCSPQLLEARLALRLLPKPEAVIRIHGLTVDVNERTVVYNGKPIPLTGSEFNILHLFLTSAGTFFTASEIYEKVWELPSLKSTSVKYHISNLRQKLLAATGKHLILTEFGKGYAFLPEENK